MHIQEVPRAEQQLLLTPEEKSACATLTDAAAELTTYDLHQAIDAITDSGLRVAALKMLEQPHNERTLRGAVTLMHLTAEDQAILLKMDQDKKRPYLALLHDLHEIVICYETLQNVYSSSDIQPTVH